ncbi:MAG TPA: hypothetical protein H9968_09625 [Candidatus Anaerobutyricum stercoris]|uniref:Uncharacterized protein n=1 Tax=Candidatus Anaerobutyricum stercoris TaxID=2838457 RepID=A0A9D2J8A2_9FIRM|nr:hypothetical protein [Candidatus Anaerobutyricum stercoris]
MSERELLQMILSEVQNANTGLNDVKSEIADLKTDVSALKTDVSVLKTDVSALKTDVDDLKLRTALIETTLENETNRNIKIIAEGHTDLSRKLDHVLQMESEKEMFLIRFNVLESEVQKMKQHFDSIA